MGRIKLYEQRDNAITDDILMGMSRYVACQKYYVKNWTVGAVVIRTCKLRNPIKCREIDLTHQICVEVLVKNKEFFLENVNTQSQDPLPNEQNKL